MTDTFVREDSMDDGDLNRNIDFTEEDSDSLNRQMEDYDRDPNDMDSHDDQSMMDKVKDKVDELKEQSRNDER